MVNQQEKAGSAGHDHNLDDYNQMMQVIQDHFLKNHSTSMEGKPDLTNTATNHYPDFFEDDDVDKVSQLPAVANRRDSNQTFVKSNPSSSRGSKASSRASSKPGSSTSNRSSAGKSKSRSLSIVPLEDEPDDKPAEEAEEKADEKPEDKPDDGPEEEAAEEPEKDDDDSKSAGEPAQEAADDRDAAVPDVTVTGQDEYEVEDKEAPLDASSGNSSSTSSGKKKKKRSSRQEWKYRDYVKTEITPQEKHQRIKSYDAVGSRSTTPLPNLKDLGHSGISYNKTYIKKKKARESQQHEEQSGSSTELRPAFILDVNQDPNALTPADKQARRKQYDFINSRTASPLPDINKVSSSRMSYNKSYMKKKRGMKNNEEANKSGEQQQDSDEDPKDAAEEDKASEDKDSGEPDKGDEASDSAGEPDQAAGGEEAKEE